MVIWDGPLRSDDRRHRSGNDEEEPTHPDVHQSKFFVVDGENEILNPTGQCAVFFSGSCRVRFGGRGLPQQARQGLADLIRANSKEIMSVLYYHLRMKRR